MDAQPLDALPLWALILAGLLALGASLETGYQVGRWRHARKPDEKDQPVGAIVGSILGLVALVLGFTFSLAATRFDARRQVVLEEANAIGTTALRARLLPEPERSEVAGLLREYVDLRIRGSGDDRIAEAIVRSEQIHELLWKQALSAAAKTPGSITTGLFIQSLNEVIDLHTKRVLVGLRNRIPLVIWVVLIAQALLAMGSVGYQSGLSATRRSPAMLGLGLAFGVVLFLIADLDRSHEGFLQTSQAALVDLRTSLEANP